MVEAKTRNFFNRGFASILIRFTQPTTQALDAVGMNTSLFAIGVQPACAEPMAPHRIFAVRDIGKINVDTFEFAIV